MLLTRTPLYYLLQAEEFSYDLHVLSTPPAFILSQDQTLQLNFHNCPWTMKLTRDLTHKLSLFSFQRSNRHQGWLFTFQPLFKHFVFGRFWKFILYIRSNFLSTFFLMFFSTSLAVEFERAFSKRPIIYIFSFTTVKLIFNLFFKPAPVKCLPGVRCLKRNGFYTQIQIWSSVFFTLLRLFYGIAFSPLSAKALSH